jgi:uncharacterized repeat protein (TIGR01451 family)
MTLALILLINQPQARGQVRWPNIATFGPAPACPDATRARNFDAGELFSDKKQGEVARGGSSMNPSIVKPLRTGARLGILAVAGVAIWALLSAQGGTGVDLVVTKSDNPDPVRVGNQLTYTVQVRNAGPTSATGVTVTDELPNSVDFASASQGCTHNASSATVTCAIGTLAVGETGQIEIVVRPREARRIRNQASATANENTYSPSDDRDDERTTVNAGPQAPGCSGQQATIVDPAGNAGSVIVGTPKRDVILGLGGDDTIRGRRGGDVICGGGGNDTVVGGGGGDELRGNRGNDVLRGRAGGDSLFGGVGGDRLNGGTGRDDCAGGPGSDREVRCES